MIGLFVCVFVGTMGVIASGIKRTKTWKSNDSSGIPYWYSISIGSFLHTIRNIKSLIYIIRKLKVEYT